jgi:hypothetical protein
MSEAKIARTVQKLCYATNDKIPKRLKRPLYIIDVRDTSRSIDTLFKDYGIDFGRSIQSRNEFSGHLVFNEKQYEKFLSATGMYTRQQRTAHIPGYANVIEVTGLLQLEARKKLILTERGVSSVLPTPYTTEYENHRSADIDLLLRLLAGHILGTVIKKEIRISVPHNRSIRYNAIETRTFQIYVWSTPEANEFHERVRPPVYIWKHTVGCRDSAFVPSGAGLPIEDEGSGYVVAELFENALFIHHDLVEEGTLSEARIFGDLMLKVAEVFKNGGIQKYAEIQMQKDLAEAPSKFARACRMTLLDQNLEQLQEYILSAESDLKRVRENFRRAARRCEVLAARKATLEKFQFDEKLYEAEFKRITHMRLVKFVRIHGNTLIILTNELECFDTTRKRMRLLGCCKIAIELTSTKAAIEALSHTEMRVPHTSSHHILEWGALQIDVISLIARCEVSTIVDFILQKITQISYGEVAYEHITGYPLVETESTVA